jgi:hypothetical protein
VQKKLKTGQAVGQGCCLYPILFNLYSACSTDKALEGFGDFKIRGQVIFIVKSTDDLLPLPQQRTLLQGMTDRLTENGRCYGMEINVLKTKVMTISREPSPSRIMIDKKQLENVEYFNYLGSIKTNSVKHTHEIKSRIAMGKRSIQKEDNFSPDNWT